MEEWILPSNMAYINQPDIHSSSSSSSSSKSSFFIVHLLWLPLLLLSPLGLITIIMECEKTVLFFPYILITVFVVATREELMRHFIRVGIYKIILLMPNSILLDCVLDGLARCDWCSYRGYRIIFDVA